MRKDNKTPLSAEEYDAKINRTIPYYEEFYDQTLDIVRQYGYQAADWLDLGCGTGTLEVLALQNFPEVWFVLADPSEKMLEQAKEKLKNPFITYLCQSSQEIDFTECFDVVTAIQSHHYLRENERAEAVRRVWKSLKKDGIFICFENVVPEDAQIRQSELLRWGRYQQRQGKTEQEAGEHNARCGTAYFPLTVAEHIRLLRDTGFRKVYVFWRSYMQMGIYAVK